MKGSHIGSRLRKIISGAQTGADRAALDVARECGFETGGWVPRGRLAEDGRIADCYPGLIETGSDDPSERTRANVREADATVIVSHGPLTGGSALTMREAEKQGKPVLHIDLRRVSSGDAAAEFSRWLAVVNPEILNVAGPRASQDPSIYPDVASLLRSVLTTN